MDSRRSLNRRLTCCATVGREQYARNRGFTYCGGESHHYRFPVSLAAANRITGSSFEAASLPNLSGEHALVSPFFLAASFRGIGLYRRKLGPEGGSLSLPTLHIHYTKLSAEVKQIRHLSSVTCRFIST
jgi:hypothetical protein